MFETMVSSEGASLDFSFQMSQTFVLALVGKVVFYVELSFNHPEHGRISDFEAVRQPQEAWVIKFCCWPLVTSLRPATSPL